jgi:hypothetical protein
MISLGYVVAAVAPTENGKPMTDQDDENRETDHGGVIDPYSIGAAEQLVLFADVFKNLRTSKDC